MTDVPVQLIVAAFQDEHAAKAALDDLKQARRLGLIKIEDAAILRKDENGKLHIKETHDVGGGRGAAFGGVAGAAIGLIAGPALLVPAVVGALVGGLTARLVDTGFSNKQLESFGERLQPGSSAIVAVVDHRWVAAVERAMAEAEADLLTAQIQADIAAQLEAGHEVAYSAIASDEGFSIGRVASGEDGVEGGAMTIDDSGVFGARYVATSAGFAVEQMAITDEGFVDAVAVGTLAADEEAVTGQEVTEGGAMAVATDEPEAADANDAGREGAQA